MSNQNRVPAGVRTGGQFTHGRHGVADGSLEPTTETASGQPSTRPVVKLRADDLLVSRVASGRGLRVGLVQERYLPADAEGTVFVLRPRVPREYRGGLGEKRGRSTALDLSEVPEPIRTELAGACFRIIDQGGRVDIGHMRMLARRLSDVISDLGPHAPSSLTGLSARDWEHQMARSRQRRAGALPPPATANDLCQQLRRCYRLLSVAYDPRPWWQQERWDPCVDPRIPQRPHEPHGRLARSFDRIGLSWLRRGLQWCRCSR